MAAHWTTQTLSDKGSSWYQDLYWHLSLNASAMRGLPLRDPQAAGEALNYHWLTNAHIGGLARSAGIDVIGLTVHAWVFAALAALLGLAFGFAQYLARSSSAGVLAAALVVVAPSFAVNLAVREGGFGNFQLLSPSHMLAMPVTLLIAWLLATALGAGRTRRRAVIVPIALSVFLVSGVKVSTLPVLACGIIAAGIALLLIRRRRIAWISLVALICVTLIATFPLFGGGGGGSSVGLFASQARNKLWLDSEPLLRMLGSRGDAALWAGFCGLLALNAVFTLPAVLGLRLRQPAGWLLLGMISSAFGVTLVLSHPGRSETYFPMGVQPLLAVAVAAGVVALVQRVPALAGRDVLGTAGAGLVVGAWFATSARWESLTLARVGFGAAVAVTLIVGLVMTLWLLGIRRGLALACVWLVAAASAHGLLGALSGVNFAHLNPVTVEHRRATAKMGASAPTPDEVAAARHLAELPTGAVVATNVHCRYVQSSDHCDARAFWVAGIGQRQVLLGGWAYTNLGRSTQGQGGRYHVFNPYPDEELYALNERAFQRPDDPTFEALKAKGVTHLFADRRASVVQDLERWCDTTFENATVTVCSLR